MIVRGSPPGSAPLLVRNTRRHERRDMRKRQYRREILHPSGTVGADVGAVLSAAGRGGAV